MSLFIADSALRTYCVNGVCYVHHPIKQKSYNLKVLENKPLKKLMAYLGKPKSAADAHSFVATMLNIKHEKAVSYVDILCVKGFIKTLERADKDPLLWEQNNWQEAGILHQHTVNTPRVSYVNKTGNAYDVALMERYVKEQAPPANYKIYQGEKIELERPDIDNGITLRNILHKTKKSTALDKEKLSRLLYFAFGKTGVREMQVTGKHVRKTVPSGGARHPYEFYLLIYNVVGIDPGIYHYQFNDHYLTQLRVIDGSEIRRFINEFLVIDPKRLKFVPQLAVVYSCVFERSMHRYRYSRSYRVMQYDLGHIYQNLEFIVRAQGLNLYSGYSCLEEKIEKLIGVDSVTESCMGYAVL